MNNYVTSVIFGHKIYKFKVRAQHTLVLKVCSWHLIVGHKISKFKVMMGK